MLKRKITQKLVEWKNNPKRVPLIIKGLRQIGKTYVAKSFALDNYENAFFLDFRKQPSLSLLFSGDFNIDEIILMISALPVGNRLIPNSRMVPNKTILIFDELQDCPNARSSLKYFKEDGRFDIICTGSLLGIEGYKIGKNVSRGIAVGFEEQIEMMPMDFEEFLWANNIDDEVIRTLKNCVDNKCQIPNFLHSKFLDLIKKYICVGGMPEAVNTFLETNDFYEVRKIQKRLLSSYKADFGTHLNDKNEIIIDEYERTKILEVFESIPKQLSKDNKKFQYSIVNKKAKAKTHNNFINWLKNYGLIAICYNLSSPEEPFDFFVVNDQFKIYVSDIGLLVGMLDDDVTFKIMSNDLGIGKGMIYENLIGESLHKIGKQLFYFTKSSGLEIDFISSIYSKPYLIEIKAKSGNTKSAKTVMENSNYKINDLLKLTSQNIGYSNNILTIPYYLSFYILSK